MKNNPIKWSDVYQSPDKEIFHIDADKPLTVGNPNLETASFIGKFDSEGVMDETLADVLIGLAIDDKELFVEISADQTPEIQSLMDRASNIPFNIVFHPDETGHWPSFDKLAEIYFQSPYFEKVIFPFTSVLSVFFKETAGVPLGETLKENNLPFLQDYFSDFFDDMPLCDNQELIENIRLSCEKYFGGKEKFQSFLQETLESLES